MKFEKMDCQVEFFHFILQISIFLSKYFTLLLRLFSISLIQTLLAPDNLVFFRQLQVEKKVTRNLKFFFVYSFLQFSAKISLGSYCFPLPRTINVS